MRWEIIEGYLIIVILKIKGNNVIKLGVKSFVKWIVVNLCNVYC